MESFTSELDQNGTDANQVTDRDIVIIDDSPPSKPDGTMVATIGPQPISPQPINSDDGSATATTDIQPILPIALPKSTESIIFDLTQDDAEAEAEASFMSSSTATGKAVQQSISSFGSNKKSSEPEKLSVTHEKPKTQSAGAPQFTKDQARVINLVLKEQKNVFFTGAAGTGKSFVLKHIIKEVGSTRFHLP